MPKKDNNIGYWLYKAFYIDYWNFNGRSRGKEFWSVILLQTIVLEIFTILHYFYFSLKGGFYTQFPFYLSVFVYVLLTTVPTITVHVRRLHDAGRTGWWHPVGISFVFNMTIGLILLPLVFIYGLIVLFFFDANLTFDTSMFDEFTEIGSYVILFIWSVSILLGIAFLFLDSEKGANKWGENPKRNIDSNEIESIGRN